MLGEIGKDLDDLVSPELKQMTTISHFELLKRYLGKQILPYEKYIQYGIGYMALFGILNLANPNESNRLKYSSILLGGSLVLYTLLQKLKKKKLTYIH